MHPIEVLLISLHYKPVELPLMEYFYQNKIDYKEITSIEGSILSKTINLIYILDYCSIYKAILTETDPTPVKSIDFIKQRIS